MQVPREVDGRLVVPPSLEVNALALAIARALNDGRLAALPDVHRVRLREIATELWIMSGEEADRETESRRHDREVKHYVLATYSVAQGA